MRFSVIDIGTNTMLLLIAEYDRSANNLNKILDIQSVPRLGKGVDSSRNILPESIAKAVKVINEYIDISKNHGSEKIIAAATSFLRDSKNKDEFINEIKGKTGITIEILSGEDEARLTFMGAVYDKLNNRKETKFSTIDIGGGSTEITIGNIEINSTNTIEKTPSIKLINGKSLDVGSVRINEKYLNHHPPSFESLVTAEDFVKQYLDKIDFDLKGTNLIGVAGTITTLAAIKLGLTEFDASKVDGISLTLDEIEIIFAQLAAMPLEEIYLIGSYMEGRADIIIPGILILKTFMEQFGFRKITVSTKGLRYGVFLREFFN